MSADANGSDLPGTHEESSACRQRVSSSSRRPLPLQVRPFLRRLSTSRLPIIEWAGHVKVEHRPLAFGRLVVLGCVSVAAVVACAICLIESHAGTGWAFTDIFFLTVSSVASTGLSTSRGANVLVQVLRLLRNHIREFRF